jgi:flagellum-specific ATP synthase
MTSLITPEQFAVVRRFKQSLSRYQRNRDLIAVGAYAAGNDPQLDEAIARYPRLEAFLQQDIGENVGYEAAVSQLRASFEVRDAYA